MILKIAAVLNPILLLVLLALVVWKGFEVSKLEYVLIWLIAFVNVLYHTLEVLTK